MITNPHFGWCDLKIDFFEGHPSFLTDVPMDLLDCFDSFFKTGSGACTFDCEENGEFVLVLSGINSYIIEEDRLITLSPTPLALAKELVSDIETYKKEWDMWNPDYEELTNVSKMARSTCLKHRTNQLKKSIEYQGVQYHAIPKSYKDPGSAFYEKSEDKTEEKE